MMHILFLIGIVTVCVTCFSVTADPLFLLAALGLLYLWLEVER